MRIERTGLEYKVFRGAYLWAPSDEDICYERDAIALVVDSGDQMGRIDCFGPTSEVANQFGFNLADLPIEQGLFIPPFYDMHFHWVQDDVREMPKASLIEWLEKYTFPAESKFSAPSYVAEKAELFWKRILRTGTVGGLCYSSIHEVALDEAMRCAVGEFRIGNTLMTMNCPDYLTQSEDEAVQLVARCVSEYGSRYVCSPRFALTTDPSTMHASAKLAGEHRCFQQTHLDETTSEIERVLSIYRQISGFEDLRTYTEIYERCRMLGPKTVFGHCIHLEPEEWEMLASSDSVIASCPSSNAPIEELGLGSGLFDFRLAEKYGVRWALASDIGGGPFLSMFDVIRSFVQQNREAGIEVSYGKALHRSTRAGAEILELGDRKGLFAEGYDFDCLRLPVSESVLDSADPEVILRSLIESVASRPEFDDVVGDTILMGESVLV